MTRDFPESRVILGELEKSRVINAGPLDDFTLRSVCNSNEIHQILSVLTLEVRSELLKMQEILHK